MNRRPLTPDEEVWRKNLHAIWHAKKRGLGLTQAVAAKKCGWNTQAAVGAYLNGGIALNLNAIIQFANLLEVSIDDIAPNSELTDALALAVRFQGDPNPQIKLEEFKVMLAGLDNESRDEILENLSDSLGAEGRTALLKIIASAMST